MNKYNKKIRRGEGKEQKIETLNKGKQSKTKKEQPVKDKQKLQKENYNSIISNSKSSSSSSSSSTTTTNLWQEKQEQDEIEEKAN